MHASPVRESQTHQCELSAHTSDHNRDQPDWKQPQLQRNKETRASFTAGRKALVGPLGKEAGDVSEIEEQIELS